MKNYSAIAIAFFLSPLTAIIGYDLAFYLEYPRDFYMLLKAEGINPFIAPAIFVVPVAFVLTLIFGLPGYLILRKFNLDKGYIIVLWAILVGGTFAYITRLDANGLRWEYGVFPALVVSLAAILILKICK